MAGDDPEGSGRKARGNGLDWACGLPEGKIGIHKGRGSLLRENPVLHGQFRHENKSMIPPPSFAFTEIKVDFKPILY